VDPLYLSHFLKTIEYRSQVSTLAAGVNINNLRRDDLAGISVPLVSLTAQRRTAEAIESYLTRITKAGATLERVQRTLKRYRASVLKAAVEGSLVPTEAEIARAEGRDFEPAPVLLERILAQRRTHDSGPPPKRWTLATLPEGWCWSSVGQLGDVTGGITKNAKREELPLQLPYLRVANVYANELKLEDVGTIGVGDSEVERTSLKRGDLLVVEGNGSVEQIGRVALWDGSISPCVHQNHLIKIRFPLAALSDWTLAWLLSPAGRSVIERVASSTSGLHTLSISKVAQLPVPLPPLAEQQRVKQEVDRLLAIEQNTLRKVDDQTLRCTKLRQSILKWAFEGKLVEQDPNGELASILLERIQAERATEAAVKPATREKRRPKVAKRA
jgi:type I restriction enzyme S subunit